jgi:hypothetical protein
MTACIGGQSQQTIVERALAQHVTGSDALLFVLLDAQPTRKM